MKSFLALIIARNKEFARDHGTLGWTFLFPFIVIAGFGFGYTGDSEHILKMGVFHESGNTESAKAVVKTILDSGAVQTVEFDSVDVAIKKVQLHQIDLLVSEGEKIKYWVNPESAKGRLLEKLLLSSNSNPALLEKETVPGRSIRYVEWLIPGILAMNMMFSSLFGVGYAIVRYRKNGVLKRIKATPVTAFQFLAAQLVSRLLLILTTSSIVFFGAITFIGFKMQGSYLLLFLFLAIGACCMISLGLAVASRIASEELAEGLLNLLTWPMMFLSGIWFSLDGASKTVLAIANVFPLTHIVSGARQIMIEGIGFQALVPSMVVLGVMGFVFLLIGSLLFKWE